VPAPLLLAALLAALPARLDVRYRMELAGEHVGWARLALACAPSGCRAVWESALLAPGVEDGELVSRRIEADTAPGGAARQVRLRASAGGREREVEAGAGPVPATLAEVLLAGVSEGERRCVEVREEESGREGPACARREGAWLSGAVLGEPIRFRAGADGAPLEVVLPEQGARFVADPSAGLPRRPPRLYGVVAPRPEGPPAGLCGVPVDPPAVAAPAELPRAFPAGASCRERTARYLERVARRGLRGRHAVGVAHDGRDFVWHEWAEVLAGGRWIAVDPSFEQAPARGPRVTLARFEDGDAPARALAGRVLLACWGSRGGRAGNRRPSTGVVRR